MGCKAYQEILTDAALGALEPSREAGLAAHLGGCEKCRGALENERRLFAAIDHGIEESVAAEPSPEFLARVRRRLEEERLPMRLWFSGWVPIAVGALAALALVVWAARRPPAGPVATETAQTVPSQHPLATEGNRATEKVGVELESLLGGHAIRQLTTRATDPKALAPPGEQAAVLRLYEALQKRRIDTASLLASPVPSEPSSLEFAPLEVASLEIRPMPPERGPDH
jgi:anti-sigma factor RsiW